MSELGGVSPVPREARPYQGHRAGLVTRMIANTIDGLVVGAVLAAAYAGLNGVVFMLDPRGFEFVDGSLLLSMMAALTVAVCYLAVGWALTGRTYGCHVMGLRVVGRRGGRVPPVVALLRELSQRPLDVARRQRQQRLGLQGAVGHRHHRGGAAA